MKSMILNKSDGGRLEIGTVALNKMCKFAQNKFYKREAGGVLLGRYLLNSLDVVIDDITIPMWGDRRSRNSFYRDRERHQTAIDEAWILSGYTTTYLGEWHTHPENVPTPSRIDFNNWSDRLDRDNHSNNTLYFVIIGITDVGVWEGEKYTNIFRLLGIEKLSS
jgi:integrative and conjugative element protein (TIGR02256 family)